MHSRSCRYSFLTHSSLVPRGTELRFKTIQQSQSQQKKMKTNSMTTLHPKESIDRSPLRQVFRFGALALVLACFGPSPAVRAVTPAPDGGYPNFNTAEGDAALSSLTSGQSNTAVGWAALFQDTTGNQNTAIGTGALHDNNGSGN